MKKFIVLYKIILLILLLGTHSLMGQNFEKSRKISKSFKVKTDTELQIANKYGDIQLIPWEKDSVRIEIDLDVIATKESKLASTFDYIDFDFNVSQHYIVAQTSFAGQGTFWSDVKDLANTVFAGGTKTQIDYKVYLPSYINVKIENKYGDIFTADNYGNITISLSNGNLKSHAFYGKSNISIQFGSANIKYIKNGELNVSYYSDIQVDNADKLKIESRSSKIYIDKISNLDIISNRDKYYLGTVKELTANNSFSFMEIKNLEKQIDVDANYGDIIIKNLGKETKSLKLNTESTEITLYKESDQTLKLKLTYDEKAGLYFNETLKEKIITKVDDEKRLVKTEGILGNGNNSLIILNGYILSGNLRINNK